VSQRNLGCRKEQQADRPRSMSDVAGPLPNPYREAGAPYRTLSSAEAARASSSSVPWGWVAGLIALAVVAAVLMAVVIWQAVVLPNSNCQSCLPRTSCPAFGSCPVVTSGSQPVGQPEVFNFNPAFGGQFTANSLSSAQGLCSLFDNGVLATVPQLEMSLARGAQWCIAGWMAEGVRLYPMQVAAAGCSSSPGIQNWTPLLAGATCFAVKPPPQTFGVAQFSPTKWSEFDP
jgi:hypothetical protein